MTVAASLSFTQAAHSLMISQSTLARRIASLEGMLNRELLVRAPRGVGLTPDGDALLPTAHRILQAVRDAQENP